MSKMPMIKELVKNILTHYKNKEETEEGEYLFFTHTEFDSNVTNFEGLSNENRIVLQSSLNKIDVLLIMRLFQSVYDDNYYWIEDINEVMASFDESDIIICETDIEKLASYNDSGIWIKYLTMKYTEDEEDYYNQYYEQLTDEEKKEQDEDIDEVKEYEASNLSATKSKPGIRDYGFKPKKKQMVYKIEDIINLITN
jgi:hypothetical protein